MQSMAPVLAIALLIATGPAVADGDIEAGKKKSAACVACHGQNGISRVPNYPNIGGQNEEYLYLSLKAYKDGTRKNNLMNGLVAGLSDQDLKDLAAYYSSL